MMKTCRLLAAAAALLLAAASVPAQPASGPGPGAAASAPRGPGMGPGPGPGMGPGMGPGGRRMGGRWGADYTPGWSLMTPQERQEHQARMRAMTSHDDCRTYMEQHHRQMSERAKEKGRAMPAQPRRDACATLKP